jgi:hypothetical protein
LAAAASSADKEEPLSCTFAAEMELWATAIEATHNASTTIKSNLDDLIIAAIPPRKAIRFNSIDPFRAILQ